VTQPTLICGRSWETGDLVRRWPPKFAHPNKKIVYDVACPSGTSHEGTVKFSRWTGGRLPTDVPGERTAEILGRPGFFDYVRPATADGTVHWHLNFADAHLFYGYGSSLFAQDELQTAEHPALGSLREALLADGDSGCAPLTEDAEGPTPVLVSGVERRCHIDTAGLYGYRFAGAPAERVREAAQRLDPPTISNILAIAAPSSGRGAYKEEEIARILRTAWAGFVSARAQAASPVTIHTGFWGCGKFGGNRILMTALQIVAAHLARTECVVFHLGLNAGDAHFFEAGRSMADALLASQPTTLHLIGAVVDQRLMWGKGDGN
jgi:poly(ADP-ribose)glycohydrolase PARG